MNKSLSQSRLVLLVPSLDFGGVETRIVVQALAMREHVRDLIVCTLGNSGDAARTLTNAGVSVIDLQVAPSIRSFTPTYQVAKFLRGVKPDILHCRIGEANWHGLIAGCVCGVPIRIAEEVGIPSRGAVGRTVFPQLYKLAHCVVGVSDATCDFLKNIDRVKHSKVVRVYNAASAEHFAEPLVRTRCPSAPFRVIAVGRLDPVKNLDMLLQAFAQVCRRHPDIALRLVGEGSARASLEQQAAELNLSDKVSFAGFQRDVRQELVEADLYVLPSHSEGFGIALVEAMACGLPVLATSVGGAAEVLAGIGENLVISPDDESGWVSSIEKFVTMKSVERLALGTRLREIAIERFSPDAYVSNLASLYSSLLDAKNACPQ